MTVKARILRALVVVAVLPLVSCGGPSAAPDPEAASPSTVVAPQDELPVGASAPFSVYAHCGFEFAQIDGSLWRTRLRDDGNHNPPPGWPQSVEGVIERRSETRAVFTGTNVEVRAVFRPAPDAEYMCA